MLQIARQRNVYDHLYLQENTSFLQSTDVAYHLIVAISVFQFQGQLVHLLKAALQRLKPEGWLFFTVAAGPLLGDGFQWQTDGYFCHSPRYVMQILGELGTTGGKMLRAAWSCPCPFTEHALVFCVQRPTEPDQSDV